MKAVVVAVDTVVVSMEAFHMASPTLQVMVPKAAPALPLQEKQNLSSVHIIFVGSRKNR
jgi:hypothetical protein